MGPGGPQAESKGVIMQGLSIKTPDLVAPQNTVNLQKQGPWNISLYKFFQLSRTVQLCLPVAIFN